MREVRATRQCCLTDHSVIKSLKQNMSFEGKIDICSMEGPSCQTYFIRSFNENDMPPVHSFAFMRA